MIILLIILILILIYVIFTYNTLIKFKLKTENAWAQIDTQLKRRFDLIPNLVETIKGYAKYEQETLEKIVNARNMYNISSSVQEKANASNMLSNTLKSIFALSENYPDLKANENFITLQSDLRETEDKIAFARQFYNDTVEMYNKKLLVFPNNLIASIFKFKAADFFEISVAEKENVEVKF